jgi:hypothetical protein
MPESSVTTEFIGQPTSPSVSNNEVIGQMLFERAKTDYPYLADKNIAFDYAPGKGRGFLEFYSPEETGSPEYPRPQNIPMGRVGVQVFDPKTRPIDILADYVSHYGVEKDPYLSERYQQFVQSFTPEQQQALQEQYAYYQQHPEYKETRPYEEWLKASGMPAYFRGYTFDQWKDSQDAYTQQQLELLNQIKQYLGVK